MAEGTQAVQEENWVSFPEGEIPSEIQSVTKEGEESSDDWGDVDDLAPKPINVNFEEQPDEPTSGAGSIPFDASPDLSLDLFNKPENYFKSFGEGVELNTGFLSDEKFLSDQYKIDNIDYELYQIDQELQIPEEIKGTKLEETIRQQQEYLKRHPDLQDAVIKATNSSETGQFDPIQFVQDESIPWQIRAKMYNLLNNRLSEDNDILTEDSFRGALIRFGANFQSSGLSFVSNITTNLAQLIAKKEGYGLELSKDKYQVIPSGDSRIEGLELAPNPADFHYVNQRVGEPNPWWVNAVSAMGPGGSFTGRDFGKGIPQIPYLDSEGNPYYLTQAAISEKLGLDEDATAQALWEQGVWPLALEFTNEVTGEKVILNPVKPGELHTERSEHISGKYFDGGAGSILPQNQNILNEKYRGLNVTYGEDGELESVIYNGREYLTARQQDLYGTDISVYDPFGLEGQIQGVPSIDANGPLDPRFYQKGFEELIPGMAPHMLAIIAVVMITKGKVASLPGTAAGARLQATGAQQLAKGFTLKGLRNWTLGGLGKGAGENAIASFVVEAASYNRETGNAVDALVQVFPELESNVTEIFRSNEIDSNNTAFWRTIGVNEGLFGIPFGSLLEVLTAGGGAGLKGLKSSGIPFDPKLWRDLGLDFNIAALTKLAELDVMGKAYQFDALNLKLNILKTFTEEGKIDWGKENLGFRLPARSGANDWGPGGRWTNWINQRKATGEIREPLYPSGYEEQQILNVDQQPESSPTLDRQDLIDFNISNQKDLITSIKATEENIEKITTELQGSINKLNEALARANETSTPIDRTINTEFGIDESLSKPLPGEVSDVPLDEISTAPQYFQVKESGVGQVEGVSGSLKGAETFEPELAGIITLWRDTGGTIGDPGRVYIVDGHNRLDLAKRSGNKTILSRFINVKTWQEARSKAALINIAGTQSLKGSIESLDIAKFLRDDNFTLNDLAARGINLQNRLVAEAVRLNRLPEELFGKVSTGELSLAKALALGSAEGVNPEAIMDIYKLAVKQRWSIGRIEQAIVMARSATVGVEEGVFPELSSYFKQSNIKQLLTVRTEVVKQLKVRIKALAPATRLEQAQLLEGVEGTNINIQGSKEQRMATQAVLNVFNRVAGLEGPVTNILTDIAANLKGNNASKLVKESLVELEEAILQESNVQTNIPRGEYNEAVTNQISNIAEKTDALSNKVIEETLPKRKPELPELIRDQQKFDETFPAEKKDSITNQLDKDGAITSDPRPIDSTPPSTRVTKTKIRPEIIKAIKEDPRGWLGDDDIWGEVPVKDQTVEVEAEEVPISEIQKLLTERPNEIPVEDLEPVTTSLSKVDPKTPLDLLIRSAPDSQQASIAINRLVDSFEKFADAREAEGRGFGPIDTVGDFINLLNIGRVAIEEGTQKGLRDIKTADRFGRLAAPYVQKAGKVFLERAIDDIEKVQIYTKALQYEIGKIGKGIEKKILDAGKEADRELANIDNWEDSKIIAAVFNRIGLKDKGELLMPTKRPTFAMSSMGKNWAGKSAPTYSKMKIKWESDVDKAIYIATNPKRSKSPDDKWWYWLTAELGIPEDEIIDIGILIRNELKENYEAGSTWTVKDTDAWKFGGNTEFMTFDIEDARLKELIEKIDEDLLRKYLDITDAKDPGDLLAKFKERFTQDYLDLFPVKGYGDATIGSRFAGPLQSFAEQEALIRQARRIFPAGKIEFPFELYGKVGDRQASVHPNLKGMEGKFVPIKGAYEPDPRGAAHDLIRVAQSYGAVPASFSEKFWTVTHEAVHGVFRRFYTRADAELLLKGEKHLREIAAIAAPHKKQAILSGEEGFGEVVSYAAMAWHKVKNQYLLPKKDVTWAQPLQKLEQVVNTVKRWLGRKGYKTWEELFEATVSGEFATVRERGLFGPVAGPNQMRIGRDMYHFGAMSRKVTEDVDFLPAFEEVNPEDFQARLGSLRQQMNKGSVTLLDLMMSEQRRLISRGKNSKGQYSPSIPGKRLYVPLNEEGIILSSKIVEDQIKDLVGDRIQRTGIPAQNSSRILHAAKELLIGNEMATEKIINLWEKARGGDIRSADELITTVAIGVLRDQNQLAIKELSVEFKGINDGEIPIEVKAELGSKLTALWTNQLVLNRTWEQITRKWGQIGKATQLEFDTENLTLQSNTSLNKYVPEELAEKVLTDGLTVENGPFGAGIYFTTDTDASLGTIVKGQLPKDIVILDLVASNKSLSQLLEEIGVNPVVAKSGLDKEQALALQNYVLEKGYDGIRLPTDLSQVNIGDQIVFYDVNAANRTIGSGAATPPSKGGSVTTEVVGENDYRTFVNKTIMEAGSLLESKLEPGIVDAINRGELTVRAELLLDELAETAFEINGLPIKDQKFYVKDVSDLMSNIPDGTGWQRTIADIRRSALFLNLSTWGKVFLGGTTRMLGMPISRYVGNGHLAKKAEAKGNYFEATSARIRQQIDKELWRMMIDEIPNALRLSNKSWKVAEVLVAPGMQHFQDAKVKQFGGVDELGNKLTEEQFKMAGENRAIEKITRRGPQWFEKPTANPIALAVRALNKFGPTRFIYQAGARRGLSAIDTFVSGIVGPATERARLLDMELHSMRAKGQIIDQKLLNLALEKVKKKMKQTWVDMIVNGERIEDAYLDSPSAQNWISYVNMTDKIKVGPEKRTWQYGLRKAQELGIDSTSEQIRYAEEFTKTRINPENVYSGRGSNIVNAGFHQARNLVNLPSEIISSIEQKFPITGAVIPTNRTNLNIFKALIRYTGQGQHLIDTAWRDINHEDPNIVANALGEYSIGALMLSTGVLMQVAGFEFSGPSPTDYRERKHNEMIGKPPHSVRAKLPWGGHGPWVNISAFDTAAPIMGIIGSYIYHINRIPVKDLTEDNDDLTMLMGVHMAAIRNALGDATLQQMTRGALESLTDMLDLAEGMLGEGGEEIRGARTPQGYALEQLFVGGSTPVFVNQAKIAVDPNKRQINESNLPGPLATLENTLNGICAKLPYCSLTQPLVLHQITGDPIVVEGHLGSGLTQHLWDPFKIVNGVLNPLNAFKVRTGSTDIVDEEMARLQGQGAQFIIWDRRVLGIKGMVLNTKELNELIEIGTKEVKNEYGLNLHEELTRIISESKTYQALPEMGVSDERANIHTRGSRVEYLYKTIDVYKLKAVEIFLQRHPKYQDLIEQRDQLRFERNQMSDNLGPQSNLEAWRSLVS